MKKILALLLVTVMLCSCLPVSALAADDAEYTVILAHLCSEEDSMNIGALHFKEILEEATDGRIKVEIYPNKQLATADAEMLEMCRNGSIQMCISSSVDICALNQELKSPYLYSYPYMYQSADELYAVADSEIGQQINQDIYDLTNGITTFGGYASTWCQIITVDDDVKQLADMSGLKIRAQNNRLVVSFLEAFKAQPTIVNYGEVYSAMQQGTVDGSYVAAHLMVSERYYEVCDYVTAIDICPHFLVPYYNSDFIESLPDDLRTIFEDCAKEYLDWIREYCLGLVTDTWGTLEENLTVNYLSDEQKAEFVEAAQATWAETADVCGGQEELDKVVELLEEYRAAKE